MTNPILKHAVALTAAVATTVAVFSSVASLADHDKAALVAAQSARGMQMAQAAAMVQR